MRVATRVRTLAEAFTRGSSSKQPIMISAMVYYYSALRKGRKLDSLPLVSIVLGKPAQTGLAVKKKLRIIKFRRPEAGVSSRARDVF